MSPIKFLGIEMLPQQDDLGPGKKNEKAVRGGLHCTPRAHCALRSFPAGIVREWPGQFNTWDEIDCFVRFLHSILQHRR
ncbi:MAG: hypothetical protein KBH99_02565 [Syntrophobacteraceae bacterium]|nr:hypothetical protein [Syntrophobacteraceae bacterium]